MSFTVGGDEKSAGRRAKVASSLQQLVWETCSLAF